MRVASWETNQRSWETKIRVPSYFFSPSTSASMASRSRWLVGSSRMRTLGLVTDSLQKTSLAASPPERLPIVFFTSSPEKSTIPEWNGGAGQLGGAMLRVPRQDRLHSFDRPAGAAPLQRSLGNHGIHQGLDAGPVHLWRQVGPTGDWRKFHGLFRGIAQTFEFLSLIARRVLAAAVEPVSGHGLTVEQGIDAMYSRPVLGAIDEALLDGIAEDVEKSLDLRRVLVGNHSRVVAALEDRSLPAGEAVDLDRQLGFQVSHEPHQLASVLD